MSKHDVCVSLTDREYESLVDLSRELELPQDRVLTLALRRYQALLLPVPQLPKVSVDTEARLLI